MKGRYEQTIFDRLYLNYKAYQRSSSTSKSAWENKKNKITLKDEVLLLLDNRNFANHEICRNTRTTFDHQFVLG